MTPSLLVRGGRLGLGGPRSDVLLAQGRVAAIAPAGTLDADAPTLQLADATVLPGLVDGHVHVEQWARRARRVDVAGTRRAEEVVERVRRRLTAAPPRPGRVVFAHGFVDGLWPSPAHKDLLDAAFGDLPVAAVSGDLHCAWLNTAALAVVGHAGHPTGVLRERDAMDAVVRLDAATPVAELDSWVGEALATLTPRGVTGLIDFEFADNLTAWRRRSRAGAPPVRIHAALWAPWLDAALDAGLRTGEELPGTGGRVHVGPYKVVADGSLNTRTAWCCDPYPTMPESAGLCLVEPEDLVVQMKRAWAGGLEPAVHAIGDRANQMVLDAFEQVGCPGRIEHAQLVRDADLPRFARRGLVTSVQPQHATADRDVADRHWAGWTHRAFAYRSLHDAGATLALGSDAPVSPLDPWLAIADAVHRTDDGRAPWHPEQSLPLEAALTAAAGGRREVSVGSLADLTVVAGDPREYDAVELRSPRVLATVVGGHCTHRADF
ncbi:amidohydrolase [Nocardioides sp.]|uniref:amidohydrolase n=1 Tax=Nocardioides sp. TaxID=35761 RepID=UPI0039E5700E